MSGIRVAVFLADGFEEVEAVTPIDYLRRAGADVIVTGVDTPAPVGSRGITIQADVLLEELSGRFDAIVLPGGMPGATNLGLSEIVRTFCQRTMEEGGFVSAICAAPAEALAQFGLLDNRRFTCYPGFEEKVSGGNFVSERVVRDGNIITSQGPGTAGEFALELVRCLFDEDMADSIAESILILR